MMSLEGQIISLRGTPKEMEKSRNFFILLCMKTKNFLYVKLTREFSINVAIQGSAGEKI